MDNDYTYPEVMVRFYDTVYNKMLDGKDVKFYIDNMLETGGPVLEIGCGTGRIFVPAIEKGVDIYGIDLSEQMLSKLKDKLKVNEHHRVSIANIVNFVPDRKFKLIICAFRTFQHILTPEEQLKALKNVFESLEDGGVFIFDLFNPNLRNIVNGYNDTLQFDGEYEPGKMLRRYNFSTVDHAHQMINLKFRFEWDENDSIQHYEYSTPFRYFFRYEIQHLVERSGFKLVKIYGDFEYNDYAFNSSSFVNVCRKI